MSEVNLIDKKELLEFMDEQFKKDPLTCIVTLVLDEDIPCFMDNGFCKQKKERGRATVHNFKRDGKEIYNVNNFVTDNGRFIPDGKWSGYIIKNIYDDHTE